MIVSLRCENFRCFRDTGMIELAPITLLVGENNSGKSSILQALHIPALTLQSEDPGVCLKLLHQDYDYGSFKDLVFQHDESKVVTLSFGAMVDVNIMRGKKLSSDTMQVTLRLTYGYLPKRKEIYLDQLVIEDSKGERLNIRQDKYSNSKKILMREYKDESAYLARLIERRGFLFQPRLDLFSTFNRLKRKFGEKSAGKLVNDIFLDIQLIGGFTSILRKIHLLDPLRVPPSRTYLYSGEMADRVGPKGELALQNYSALLKRGKKEDIEKVKSINNALYQLGFIKKLDVQKIGTRHYEFWTQHKESSFSANLSDTGFGISQVIPVIISLYTSSTGSTLLYEQPEIHLHPAAQAELGSVFVKAYSPKKRIVIETHSESLILRIQTEVAKGTLKQEDVRIYYIQPNSLGHQVVPIPLNEKGEFLAEWPKGFFEENYQESLKLSKARH
ncbi:MAG: DUF3696 domain-containing protein [Candidatus Marinimicrobia bacterium]|nr:DUF3696 domain-containing protein [Candidatus Neomarinimicrobiota bacterium]